MASHASVWQVACIGDFRFGKQRTGQKAKHERLAWRRHILAPGWSRTLCAGFAAWRRHILAPAGGCRTSWKSCLAAGGLRPAPLDGVQWGLFGMPALLSELKGRYTKKSRRRVCRTSGCDPCRIQTYDLLIRSQMLYSAELTGQGYYSASLTVNLRSLMRAFLPARLRR